MKKLLYIVTCFIITSCSHNNLFQSTQESLRKATIVLKNKELEIDAGSGYFWDLPIYNQSKTVCYIMKNQGLSSTGWNPYSIIKVTPEKTETVLVNSDLSEN
ncbi:MAG: hypothetical protein NE328_20555 [Lentisphaeraceae bacterium]|nr:hypothetical protein [Lentisphaeraceae bacterium]